MALIKCCNIFELADRGQKPSLLPRFLAFVLAGTLSGCTTSAWVPAVSPPVLSSPQHQDAVGTLLVEAHHARVESRLDDAEGLLNRAMRINPTSPEVYYQMALLRQAQGRTTQVYQLAERALSLGPNDTLTRDIKRLIGHSSR